MIDKETIGKIIQKLRLEKNLTQEELSEKIGITPNYLSKVERGLSKLNAESFLMLFEVLSCNLNDFGVNVQDDNNVNREKELLIKKILSTSDKKLHLYLKAINFVDSLNSDF